MLKNPKFALMGAAGFVAPRHMAAIQAVGGKLVAACDRHDAVGILDRYFPRCEFFPDQLSLMDWCRSNRVDYMVVCLPNHLHFIAARDALKQGINVILEKPAALSMAEVSQLQSDEIQYQAHVTCILQMRLHHDAELLLAHERERDLEGTLRPVVRIDYHTPRGPWYQKSWKSDSEKSGGLAFNIGIHLFDLALCAWGPWTECSVGSVEGDRNHIHGELRLDRANVNFDLSINGQAKSRRFRVANCEYDFTNGFDDLHIASYRRILAGKGFSLVEAAPAIGLCEHLSAQLAKELELHAHV